MTDARSAGVKDMNRNRNNRPSDDGRSVPDMTTLTVPHADSKAPQWDALKQLIGTGVDCLQVFRVYAVGDALAERVPSQVGPVSAETVLYLDSRSRPRTATRLPDGEWTSRPGWGEPAKRAPV